MMIFYITLGSNIFLARVVRGGGGLMKLMLRVFSNEPGLGEISFFPDMPRVIRFEKDFASA